MRDLRIDEQRKLLSMMEQASGKKLKVAIYARKSREDKEQISLDSQIQECLSFISRHSSFFDIDSIITYAEDNVSGMNIDSRPEFNKLKQAVLDGAIKVVISTKIDRLSRDSQNTIQTLEFFESKGTYFIAGDDLGDNSAAGILIKQIMWATAEFSVRRSIEDMMRVKISRTKAGYSAGGPANYGYSLVNKQYVQEPFEASVVSFIFDSVLNGQSYQDISEALEAQGITSRTGKRFSLSTIHDILTNERNCGINIFNAKRKRKVRKRVSKLEFDEAINDTAITEPIVSKDVFDRVQKLLKDRAIPKHRRATKPYILTGRVQCAKCRSSMTGDSFSSGPKKQRIRGYSCKNHKLKKSNRCPVSYVNADHLETLVKSQIEELVARRVHDGVDRNLITNLKAKDEAIIKNLSAKVKRSLNSIDKLVLAMANAKSETVISSINKQIHQAEEQINITSSHIDKAKARLESIDSKLSTLIIDGNTLFSNTALTSEIISELDIRIIADTNNVVITIGEGE